MPLSGYRGEYLHLAYVDPNNAAKLSIVDKNTKPGINVNKGTITVSSKLLSSQQAYSFGE